MADSKQNVQMNVFSTDYLSRPVYEITDIKELHARRDHDVASLSAEAQKWFEAKTKAELQIASLEAKLNFAMKWGAEQEPRLNRGRKLETLSRGYYATHQGGSDPSRNDCQCSLCIEYRAMNQDGAGA